MNQTFLLLALLFCCCDAHAQSIGIGTNSPHSSAILDVSSNGKGLLIPRLTTVQRNAIAAPAKGLLVYDSTANSLWHYDGSTWRESSATAGNGWSF